MTQEKYIMHDGTESWIIRAEEGNVLQRIADGATFGNELYLGYTYYINGVKQDPPHWEIPADYTEVVAPEPEPENE